MRAAAADHASSSSKRSLLDIQLIGSLCLSFSLRQLAALPPESGPCLYY